LEHSYKQVKVKQKQMENLTPEQVVEKINGLLDEKMGATATKSEVESLKTDLEGFKTLEVKSQEIEKAIARMEGRLEAMAEKAVEPRFVPKSVADAIVNAYVSNIDKIKDTAEKGGMLSLDVKSTTINADYDGVVALSTLEPGVDNIARPVIKVRNVVNTGTTSSKFVVYISQGRNTEASWVTEGETKPTSNPGYEEVSVEVKKVASTVKVSKEMLADLAFVRSEINADLMAGLDQAFEYALINGAGGTSLDGLLGFAQPFAAGTFAGTIPAANVSDVIRVAKAQIQGAKFEPTHVLLHPEDAAKIELTKATDGGYTYPAFWDRNMMLAGLIVVTSTNIAPDTFLVGDMSKSNVRIRENMNLQVGYVNDDFQRNMVTILAEMRAAHYVKNNQVEAFVTGDFTTAIAALDSAV
jgi:HK97 family phage major capsid protein